MGDPAVPTATDRAASQQLATAIVTSVTDDAKMPLPAMRAAQVGRDVYLHVRDVEQLAFQLAQEITLLLADREVRA